MPDAVRFSQVNLCRLRAQEIMFEIIFILVLLTLVLLYRLRYWRQGSPNQQRILRKWAHEQGFQIVECRRALFTGPFHWFTTVRDQSVFSVKVHNRENLDRSGWVRVQTARPWGGLFDGGVAASEGVEVMWNEP